MTVVKRAWDPAVSPTVFRDGFSRFSFRATRTISTSTCSRRTGRPQSRPARSAERNAAGRGAGGQRAVARGHGGNGGTGGGGGAGGGGGGAGAGFHSGISNAVTSTGPSGADGVVIIS
jgi:hypothetical protein